MDGKTRSDLKPDLKVKIVIKNDQRSGTLTEGIVAGSCCTGKLSKYVNKRASLINFITDNVHKSKHVTTILVQHQAAKKHDKQYRPNTPKSHFSQYKNRKMHEIFA